MKFTKTFTGGIPAAKEALAEISGYLALNFSLVPDGERQDLRLILSELLFNAVIHGSLGDPSKSVLVEIEPAGAGAVSARVVDGGPGFDYEAVLSKEAGLFAETGRGLALVKALADRLEFRGSGNEVRFYKKLKRLKKVLILNGQNAAESGFREYFPASIFYAEEEAAEAFAGEAPDIAVINCPDGAERLRICAGLRKRKGFDLVPMIIYLDRPAGNADKAIRETGADGALAPDGKGGYVLLSRIESVLRAGALKRRLEEQYLDLRGKNELLRNQLRMGRMVQRALIKDHDFSLNGVSIATKYLPAIEIGGDFLDIIPAGGKVSVIIGDVSGHGISAALLTAMLGVMTKSHAARCPDPALFLYRMNNELFDMFLGSELPLSVCAFYALIDTEEKLIRYSNAGQPPPIFVRGETGAASELSCAGTSLGLFRDSAYETKSLSFAAGDALLLYTDGLADNAYKRDPAGFYDRAAGLLLAGRGRPAAETLSALAEACAGPGEGGEPSPDDVSLALCLF